MGERTNFSLREFFFPFKNKWANLSIYILATALSIPLAVREHNDYLRDVERYNNREISRGPKYSDYGPIGRLERWVFDNEEETTR